MPLFPFLIAILLPIRAGVHDVHHRLARYVGKRCSSVESTCHRHIAVHPQQSRVTITKIPTKGVPATLYPGSASIESPEL
ncbi:uncharacterized protein BDZ83DRAFT_630430 [Colletotrichum acutatum]|uniref:Secreted protein n=1 Tax=Glomerella acutata TaxID=27357 RepID=A0AAD8UDB4_GLOAC|nr:uncharacterized protein BDZ83DRAFT_630430 [Colletotrichum acutatum]KAK1721301.1 hypothetical protein BDZ83DRAFT_630430 [Colletotrichum acutatum]